MGVLGLGVSLLVVGWVGALMGVVPWLGEAGSVGLGLASSVRVNRVGFTVLACSVGVGWVLGVSGQSGHVRVCGAASLRGRGWRRGQRPRPPVSVNNSPSVDWHAVPRAGRFAPPGQVFPLAPDPPLLWRRGGLGGVVLEGPAFAVPLGNGLGGLGGGVGVVGAHVLEPCPRA